VHRTIDTAIDAGVMERAVRQVQTTIIIVVWTSTSLQLQQCSFTAPMLLLIYTPVASSIQ